LCPQLRCYKNLRAEIFDNNTEGDAQKTMEKVSKAASCKEWQLHRDGFSPSVAEQRQTQGKNFTWIKIAAVASIVAVIVTIVLHIKGCPSPA
jgi:hypothetical protein